MGLNRDMRLERAPVIHCRSFPSRLSRRWSRRTLTFFAETEAAMARLLEVTRRRGWGKFSDELLAGRFG